ncbi:hypothetical protein [Devosia sp. RR2S18]|uniref:hypothetical protein n=1 Tax=Devosia rhizosphaerae TaxID=3049774 RepID=UPI0025410445|nr:hypothetical protein [Devosia sp. RR2S18]WIJ24913.1 hypothetical protein QOV41_18180 [Devosia sp. RR2S18]
MRITRTATMMLLATTATATLMQPAQALEAQAFVDRVEEVYRHFGYDLEFGPATLDGDTITVEGVTANLVDEEEDHEDVTTETTFTFSGVTEREDGSYLVDSLTVPDLDTPINAEPPGHITLADIRAEGLYIPAGEPTATDGLQLVESISTGPLAITREGEEVITMDSLVASSTFDPELGAEDLQSVTSELAITGLWADLVTLNDVVDGDAETMLEEVGLSEISGDVTQTLSWSLDDGHMVMDEFLFDFADLGSLNITFDVTGVTPELLEEVNAMGEMNAESDEELSEEEAQAQMMQGMALMQNVEIASASIRYDDASLVGNLLDYYAEKAGVDRATFVETLQAQAANMLAGVGVASLADLLDPAIDNFLDDPQSLEISVNPANPTSLLVLMAAAANPEGLITALNLTVDVNE